MKWIFRLVTIGMLAGALAVPFFINNKQGKPMLEVPKVSDLMPSKGSSSDSGKQTFYKWKDNNGVWHYGDTPPPNQEKFSTIDVNSNTNVIQSTKKREVDKPAPDKKSTPAKTEKKQEKNNPAKQENPVSLERAMNILNEAQQVQGKLDQHNQQMERYIQEAGK